MIYITEKLRIVRLDGLNLQLEELAEVRNKKTARSYIKALREEGVLAREKQSRAELTREIIRTAYNNGETNPYVLAKTYHLSAYTVKDILVKLGLERQRPKKNYKKRNQTDITKLCEKTQAVCEEIKNGVVAKDICEKYKVTRQYVSLLKKKYFKEKNCEIVS